MKHVFFGLFLHVAVLASQAHAEPRSYVIVDNQTGHILEAKNRDERLPIASLTKIATAIVVLDWSELTKSDLSALAEVPPGALAHGASSSVGLRPGDQISLRDLIYCALLASDNIAAHTLADHVGSRVSNHEGLDPVGNFVAHMNALARNLSMSRTVFLNPSGMDHREDMSMPRSTAADMARLVRHALGNAGFAFYVSQKSRPIHVFRDGIDNASEIKNTNELLGRDGIDGVKTGRTRRAGDCLVLSSTRPAETRREGEQVFVTPRRIDIVLLRSPDRFTDGMDLIRRGWSLYDAWAAEGRPSKKNASL